MATLTNTKIKDTYDGLLKTTDNDVIGASEKNITDGLGNASVLSIGTASASFSSDIEVNTLTIGKGANDVSTNTALGYQTLENATGAGNTAVGYASLLDDTTGVNNTAVGSNSLRYNTTGGNNTAIGIHSLAENTTASNNTAIGSYALADNTTGGSNVAVGQDTLSANTTGSNITAVGRGSMSNATAGDNNTALGFYSLVDNQASNNVAVGDLALRYNTTGSNNTAIGHGALDANTTGQKNVAVGSQALSTQTIGSFSTALGFEALMSQTTGSNNTAVGYASMRTSTTGTYNTAIGVASLYDNTTGSNNVAIGRYALTNSISGDSNIGIGTNSGNQLTTGSNNIYIGGNAEGSAATNDNEIVIGYNATGNGSNTATYGDSNITHHYFTSGTVRIDSDSLQLVGATNPTILVQDSTSGVEVGLKALETSTKIDSTHTFNIEIGSGNDIIQSVTSSGVEITGNLAVDTNTLYVDAANNRVGIGTSSPSMKMHINGDTSAMTQVGISNTSTGEARIYFDASNGDFSGNDYFSIGQQNDLNGIIDLAPAADLRILTNGSERMRIDSSGNVGIGEQNPQTKLHLTDTSTDFVALRIDNANTSDTGTETSEIRFLHYRSYVAGQNDAGSIIVGKEQAWNASGNRNSFMSFSTRDGSAGVLERMRIDSSGNVGIGESSARNARLLLNNAGSQGAPQLMLVDSGDSGKQSEIRFDSGDLIFDYWSGASRSERMRIDSSGNVGINESNPASGISTNSKTLHISHTNVASISLDNTTQNSKFELASLDISGGALSVRKNTSGATSGATELMRIDSSGNVTVKAAGADQARTLSLQGTNGASETYQFNLVADGANAAAKFMIGVGGGAASERMRIDSSGNIGINTQNPSAGAIGGKVLHLVNSGATASIRVDRSDASTSGTLSILSGNTTNGIFSTGSKDLTISTNSTEAMRITSGGDVLVGDSSFVADSLRIDQNGIISTSRTGTSTQVHHNFYNGNGLVGTISTSGSSTAYNTSSDYRLKENVVEMTGALDRVDALKPSRFNFIADPEKTVDGFLAHEVAEVVPEAVTGEKDAVDEEGNPIYQGIDQSKIVPLLVGAIKELRAEIETLKSQLNA